MSTLQDRFTFTMSISLKAHEVAQRFCKRQPDADKAKQIYLNTLAVYSVYDYLTYLNIPTSLSTSNSWDSSLQYLMDVADLDIPNYGRVECRPVLPEQDSCYVPSDVWSDRVGYLAVQFDPKLTEATFLGFLPDLQPNVIVNASGHIPLNEWRSVEAFIETLPQVSARQVDELETMDDVLQYDSAQIEEWDPNAMHRQTNTQPNPSIATQVQQTLTHLSQWLEGVIATEWQMIDHAFSSSDLTPSFRTQPTANTSSLETPEGSTNGSTEEMSTEEGSTIVRSKKLQWDSESDGIPLILILGLAPTETPEMDIWVELKAQDSHTYLPLDLTLMVVDDTQQPVIQTQSRGTEGIQLKFGGYPNERFSVKVVQGQWEIIETFMV